MVYLGVGFDVQQIFDGSPEGENDKKKLQGENRKCFDVFREFFQS